MLRKAALKALSHMGCQDAELSILITGDRKMRRLNREWRGIDSTTDVLSFSMLEGDGLARPDDAPLVLGDVVISAPRALAQAEEAGHPFEEELLTLLTHGILHIMGYDHEKGKPARLRMEKKQRELLISIKKR
jgi:probable rRNA maturation factor